VLGVLLPYMDVMFVSAATTAGMDNPQPLNAFACAASESSQAQSGDCFCDMQHLVPPGGRDRHTRDSESVQHDGALTKSRNSLN
jgi:hypothetical protein